MSLKRTTQSHQRRDFFYSKSPSYVPSPSALRTAEWAAFSDVWVDTRRMGRFLDLEWYDLSVTKSTGFATTINKLTKFGTQRIR